MVWSGFLRNWTVIGLTSRMVGADTADPAMPGGLILASGMDS